MCKKFIGIIYLFVNICIICCGCEKKYEIINNSLLMPKDLQYINNYYQKNMDEIYVSGIDENLETKIWESKDGGNNWKESINIYTLIKYDKNSEFCKVFWQSNGEIYCEKVYQDMHSGNTQITFFQIRNKKIEKSWKFSLESLEDGSINVIDELYRISEDVFLQIDLKGKCYIFDTKTKEIKHTFIPENDVLTIGGWKNYIIQVKRSGIDCFDYETKIKTEWGNNLVDNILKDANSCHFYMKDHKKIYLEVDKTIYEVNEKKIIKIFDHKNSYMRDPSIILNKFNVIDDYIYFYVSDISDGEEYIKIFPINEKESGKKVLNIYSLTESQTLYKAIEQYMDNNSNVYFRLNIGSDRIKQNGDGFAEEVLQLKEEIKKGTIDIAVLEGLPESFYYNDKFFIELTDKLEHISSETIRNVFNTYKRDEKIYAVPTKFVVSSVVGDKSLIQKTSEDCFTAFTGDEKNIFYSIEPILYKSFSSKFIKDGGIIEEELKKYIMLIEKLYLNSNDKSLKLPNFNGVYFSTNYMQISQLEKNIIGDYITWPGYDIPKIRKSIENKGLTYALYSLEKGEYIPNVTVAVCKNTKELSVSIKFLEHLLSDKIQSIKTIDGMPVNKMAFKRSLELLEYGEELEQYKLNSEEKEKLMCLADTLHIPSNNDFSIEYIIRCNVLKYLSGEYSMEETIEKSVYDVKNISIKLQEDN